MGTSLTNGFATITAVCLLPSLPALGQDVESDEEGVGIRLRGGGQHQFETDIDGGGEYDVMRFNTGLDLSFELGDDLDLVLDLGIARDMYDFSGGSGSFGMGSPWDDINTGRIGARFNLQAADQWDIWGGPLLGVSAEDGADIGDAITGGGTVGFTHHFNDDLSLGAGIGVVTQIEDSAAIYPIIVIDWRIDEDLRLRSGGSAGARGGGGVELIWEFAPDWEFGVGGAYESRRFRLDDSGLFPDGVGDESLLPVFARLGYDINANMEFNFIAGVIASGELRLENSRGIELRDEDIDSTPFVGINFRLRF